MDVSFDEADLQTGEVIPATGEVRDENTFNILIATDNHLGYCDNNAERENDSFITFEEILELAHKHQVDMILLGGDLFHENKPKANVLRRTIGLLRKHCLGDRPVSFEYIGMPEHDFRHEDDPEVNYYNAHINIGMPIFTIHGNHDDPIGSEKTSAVDHLSSAKLLNHFGQWDNLNKISITPVLLTKGETKLALYGLGHLKDERLYRLMHDRKVQFLGPEEDSESWFNLFVLHQNRVKHGPKNYIPENFIPGYMNLVLWGHEHECRIKQERIEDLRQTFITQPGSSVATSLCAGEAVDKHVAILKINRRKFRIEPIKLETVRPMVLKDIMVKDVFESLKMKKNATAKERSQALEKYIEGVVEGLIRDAEDKLTNHPKQPTKPLVRVRIFHDDVEDSFNPVRFSQKFAKTVANEDIVMFKKTPMKREGGNAEIDVDEIGQLMMQYDDDDLDGHVESIVESYFAKLRTQEGGEAKDGLLEILSERGLSEAVKSAVEKDDDKLISMMVDAQVEKTINFLIEKEVTEETADELLEQFRERRQGVTADQEKNELETLLASAKPSSSRARQPNASDEVMDIGNGNASDGEDSPALIDIEADEDDYSSTSSSRSRGGAGRGGRGSRSRGGGDSGTTRGGRGSRGGRARAIRDDSPSPPATPPATTRGRGRGRGRGAAAEASARGKKLVQTTLPIRRSPRKGSQMAFDADSDSD